jgi:hypothetical protein
MLPSWHGDHTQVVVLIAGLQKDAGVQLGAMGVLFATHVSTQPGILLQLYLL